MAKVANNPGLWRRRLVRTSAWFLLLLLTLVLVVQTSAFRSFLGRWVSDWLTERGGYPVQIASIRLDGLRTFEMLDFTLQSPAGDTLLFTHRVEVRAPFLQWSTQKIPVRSIDLQQLYVQHHVDSVTGQSGLQDWISAWGGEPQNTAASSGSAPEISVDRINGFGIRVDVSLLSDSGRSDGHWRIDKTAFTIADFYWDGRQNASLQLEGFRSHIEPYGSVTELSGGFYLDSLSLYWMDARVAFRDVLWAGQFTWSRADSSQSWTDAEGELQLDELRFSDSTFARFATTALPSMSVRAGGTISGSRSRGVRWESARLDCDSIFHFRGGLEAVHSQGSKISQDSASSWVSRAAWSMHADRMELKGAWAERFGGWLDSSWLPMVPLITSVQVEGDCQVDGGRGGVDAQVRTPQGTVQLKLDWSQLDQPKYSRYRGRVAFVDVQLGHWLRDTNWGRTGFSLNVDGRGMPGEDFDVMVSGVLNELTYANRRITGARLDGRAAEQSFTGTIEMNNQWVEGTYNGSLGWDSVRPYLNSRLDIARLDLIELGWQREDSIARLQAEVDVQLVFGSDWLPQGSMSIRNLDLETSTDYHHLDSLDFLAYSQGDSSVLRVQSAWFDADVRGVFRWNEVPGALQRWANQQFYPGSDALPANRHEWSADIAIADLEPITRLVLPQFEIAPHSRIQLEFNEPRQSMHVRMHSDAVAWAGFRLDGLEVRLQTDPNGGLLSGGIYTDSTDLGGFRTWHYAAYELTIRADTLFNRIHWRDATNSIDKGVLNTYFTTDSGRYFIGWMDSKLDIVGRDWRFQPGFIEWSDRGTYLHQFHLSSGAEVLYADGWITPESGPVHIKTEALDLNWLNLITRNRFGVFEGELNTDARIYGDQLHPYGVGTLAIDHFVWNKVPSGKLEVRMEWEDEIQAIGLIANWAREEHQSLYAAGAYYPTSTDQRMDLQLRLDSFDLSPINTYTYHFMRDIRGGLTGRLKARLSDGLPTLTGELALDGAEFLLPITQVRYGLNNHHKVQFNQEEITINNLVITDKRYGTRAIARGTFAHQYLNDWKIDLHLDADSLFALNTTRYDEDAYYGRAFATGTFDLVGTPLALDMNLDARTNRGTSFHIPLSTASEVGQARFISFRSPTPDPAQLDKAQLDEERNKTTDIDMAFRIQATPDAEVELIFDPTVGDAIRGRGTGELVMEMDREGDIQLWGEYTLKEGDYLFTLQNLINKKFLIQPGGTLKWDGDPYNAQMNMVARYPLRTSLKPLQISDTSRTKQRVFLDLGLSEELLQPKLQFNVLTPDAPTAIQEEVNTVLQSDQNELNRQVFALLIMNSFLTPEYANRTAGTDFFNTGLTANTTEVLSNQLSRWVSQIDDRIDLGVNYESGGVYEEQQIEVALSTQLFNDRVALNGNLGVPIGQEHTSTIVGDVEVEVLLSQDGQFRARAFNRSTQFDPLVSQYQYRQGVGVVFSTAFNNIAELREKLFGRTAK